MPTVKMDNNAEWQPSANSDK